jgi:hypothetical protein
VANYTSAGGQVLSGTGGAAGAGGQILSRTGGAAGAGGAGTAGTSAVCPAEQKVGAPNISTDCQIAVRSIDPASTCGSTDCAITKALDLTCASVPAAPWLAATADGAVLLVTTDDSNNIKALARLMTVEAANSRVQDVPALADPNTGWSYFSILNSAFSTNSSGAKWLFAGRTPGITALRGTDAGWTRSTVVSSSDFNQEAYLTDVSMVDDRQGYLTYYAGDIWAPHLVTWDGSCWTDQLIGEPQVETMVVETDAERQPWVAWLSTERTSGVESLYLRSPSGDTQNLLANVTADAPGGPLRLLPGGLDGTAAFPAVVAGFSDGIRVLSNPTNSGWQSLLLRDSATAAAGGGDCPYVQPSRDYGNHCAGMTSCTHQASGVGSGFGLARTQSGATFAVWVAYSSQGNYALTEACDGGEMPLCYCDWTETSGTGTADLVVARLTDSGTTLTHFRFVMGGADRYLINDVAMVARGDTLVVTAYLSGDTVPTLTYLEIDSHLLP